MTLFFLRYTFAKNVEKPGASFRCYPALKDWLEPLPSRAGQRSFADDNERIGAGLKVLYQIKVTMRSLFINDPQGSVVFDFSPIEVHRDVPVQRIDVEPEGGETVLIRNQEPFS
jgi:hypothetical protein